jgi:RNA polymerase sigma-70 factor (ECF subfamily)
VNEGRAWRCVARLEKSEHLPLLLEQMSRGDRDAFVRFYDDTSSVVYGMALMICKSQRRAEAVTHQVYVTAWATAPAYQESQSTPMDWLMSMASDAFIASIRADRPNRTRSARTQVRTA